MNKVDFVLALTEKLSFLSREEISERVEYYAELIDDQIEDGISEAEAVAAVGSVDEIVAQIIADIPLAKIAKERIKPQKRLKAWEIVLLVLGSPIWLSLGIAAFAVILSLYISLWAVIISLWAVFGSLVGCAFGGTAAGIVFICRGSIPSGIMMIGAGILCAGLSILLFFGCKAAVKGTVMLTKKLAVWTKNCFIRKEEA